MGSKKIQKITPFVINKREVNGGIYNRINTEFTGGVEIGSYHLDNYAELDTAVLQSPITNTWVGGHTHRHVPLNIGNDEASNRPEAWHIEFDNITNPNNPTITFHSYEYLNSPSALFTREEYAKRPLNIKNIKQNSLGNFKHNYEVLQTSGRRIANNLIADGFIAGGVLTTQFITGSHNYSLPVLNSESGSKSVIVERFNAPGSKEESSRGALDREGEEMSSNISLPWRNYKIRQPFYSQLSQSTPQFGTSIHGVHRNTLPASGSRNEENDNGFVNRPIPRTDIQYSWITASSTTTAGELGGYQAIAFGESDIEFISGSEIVVDNTKYIIDNLGISSLIKDKKQLDLDAKTVSYSSDIGMSASFGELTHSPYSFTTWNSLRTGEHPISRALRKNNIISVQARLKPEEIKTAKLPYDGVEYNRFRKTKRSATSLNFSEPAVTFKYKPLKTKVRLAGAPEGSEQVIVHTFTNNIGNFANEDLRIETGLEEKERSEQFYDFLRSTYNDAGATGNPIAEFLGYQYSEVVWPREENTGLSRTRKREAYILDQPGFDRDGYDRQLGTQRVFWRDNQEDRKRSRNSEGGYYSSMNYLSTEETGSDFVQYEEGVLSDNKFVTFSSSFITSSGLEDGLFNSILLNESTSSEKDNFSFTSTIESQYYQATAFVKSNFNSIKKRNFSFANTGEFNSIYNDFYEQSANLQTNLKQSLGSLYRNTGYKYLLTSLPTSRENYNDFSVKTEDEIIQINPKVKYTSFIGGAELNTGSFFQDLNNFSNLISTSNPLVIGDVDAMAISGSILFFGGNFYQIGNEQYNSIASYDLINNTYNQLGAGLQQNTYVEKIIVSGSDLYVCGDFTQTGQGLTALRIARYNIPTNTWWALGTSSYGANSTIKDMVLSGSDLYVVGAFTQVDNMTSLRIAKYDTLGNQWYPFLDGLESTGNAIVLSGSNLYVGGDLINIYSYDTTTYTKSIIANMNFYEFVSTMEISGNYLYVGGNFTSISSSIAGNIAKYDTSTNTWSDIHSSSNPSVDDISFYNNELYVATGEYPVYVEKWDGVEWSDVGTPPLDNLVYKLLPVGNRLYASGRFIYASGEYTGKIAFWDGLRWNSLFKASNYNLFSDSYFTESTQKSDFIFSTLDNGIKNNIISDSGKKPFDDSYENFIKNINSLNKDYCLLAEFNISKNLEYYIKNNNSNFRAENKSFLELDGAKNYYNISNSQESNYNNIFINNYLSSDILVSNTEITKDNKEIANLEKISLKIHGIKKLFPYQGFYPQDRTIQLSNLYNDYIEENIKGGIYNLSYFNDYVNQTIIEAPTTGSFPRSMSAVEYNNKHYLAIGYPDLPPAADNGNPNGVVKIYSSILDSSTEWDTDISSSIRVDTTDSPLTDFGSKVQLISASNGLNLFSSAQLLYSGSIGSQNGFILHSLSKDGTTWSTPKVLEVFNTTPFVYISGSSSASGFQNYFEICYTSSSNEEKIVISIGSPIADPGGKNAAGEVYVVTGTLSNEQWLWSDKTLIYTGSLDQNAAGQQTSVIYSNNGYQIFFVEGNGDKPTTDAGNILVSTSSIGDSWSEPIVIASGSNTTVTKGIGDIDAIDFNNKTYLFFSDYGNDTLAVDAGAVFCISSSNNNQWPDSDTFLEKKMVYSRNLRNDKALYNSGTRHVISLFSGSDDRLHYGLINSPIDVASIGDTAQLIIGYMTKDEVFQDLENENYLSYIPNVYDFGINTITVSGYRLGEYKLPMFFTDIVREKIANNSNYVSYDITQIKNNGFTDFTLRVSGSEKFYKHAALEPFMAPGILYNTIKSGIAVDWPCATGSNTAIEPYGNNTIVNAYYPKAFEMANFSGSNIYESLYGHLRSNIDYRVPFENIIFPGEAFPVKDFLSEDLVRRTVLTTLPDNDPLVEFINGAYIYGGYEPYISPVDFSDINNLGPKRFSVPFVYRKAGSQDSGLYTLAMSNFLAETVKFFLKDEKMTTFVSDPDYKWKEFNSSKTYYMDIVLEKSPDLVMMEAYHSDLHPTGSNGEKMNGRYFGYPINKTDKEIWGEEDFTAEEKKLIHNDPAYAPYTPPYFEGVARARISFKPQTSGKYTLQEVFDNATVENIFVDIAKGATTGSDAYVNAMPINSSIDIFGAAQAVEVTIDETSGEQTVRELQDSQNWIISPRMETPVLDFSSQELTPYENNYSKTGGFGRGMWSGYGSIPTNGKGIKVRLEDPFATRPGPNTGSLLNQVGLRPEERNVGSIADTKLISEAVVVIPYLDQNTRSPEYSTARKNKTDFEFIKISKKLFNKQLSNYRKGKPAISPGDVSSITLEEVIQDTSITEMIEKMEKYVIPPEMNFLEYTDIEPFVMYIFEFEHVLDQEDLKDIWQGLMPKISYTAEEDSVSISHDSAPYEFFEGKEIPENLRWMVFKIKRKAEYNYFNVTSTTKDDTRFNFNKIIGRKEGTDVYSYNWPYDFFSLVEFAKVELMLDYKKKEE